MKCDICGKKEADYNFQVCGLLWEIDKNGDYSDEPEYLSCDENIFYCKQCWESEK